MKPLSSTPKSSIQYHLLNKPTPNPIIKLIEKVNDRQSTDPESIIVCAHCHNAITSEAEKTRINGASNHVFTNPYGYTFNIICFHEALGCLFEGPLIAADTWFPGYFWQYALCSSCHSHLGWHYTRASTSYFYGLIANRICNHSSNKPN